MMKNILFSVIFLLLPSFFCSETKGEKKAQEVVKKESVFTPARLGAQVGSIVVWITIIALGFKYGFSAKESGAFNSSDFKENLNLIIYSVLSVFVGFYSYYLSERVLSEKTTSKLGKFLSGFGALLFCSLSSFAFFQSYLQPTLRDIVGFGICYLVTGLIGSLFTALLPWLTYKGIDRFIIK